MKIFKILQYVLIITIVALAISRLAPHLNDFGKLWELRGEMDFRWVLAAIFSQVFQYIGDGWFSQLLLKIADIKVRFKDSMRIASLNVFAAHILPVGEAGGLAAAYHFYRKLGVDTEKFIFLSICWTGITHFLLLLLFIIPSFFLEGVTVVINTSIILISIAIITLVFLSIYIGRKHLYHKLKNLIGKYKWAKPFFSFAHNRKIYVKRLKSHPWLIFWSLIASLIYYGSNIATLVFAFMTFHILPSLNVIIFAYAASLLFSKLTLAPAGIGAAEITLISIFVESHIDPAIALGATLIYRLISFWLPIPAGFFSFYSLKKETKDHHKDDIKAFEEELF